MKYDAVIIDSGVAGMTAALILSKQGMRVAMIEKSPAVAPVLRGFFRQGVYCDTGFHFSGMLKPGLILHRFFRYLGIDQMLDIQPLSDQSATTIIFPDGQTIALPVGFSNTIDALLLIFPEEEKAIRAYFERVAAEIDRSPFLNGTSVSSWLTNEISNDTLSEFLDTLTNNKRLKKILSIRCLLHGVPSQKVAFSSHARVDGGFILSSHTFRQGGKALVEALSDQLARLPVDIITDNGVQKIDVSDKKVTGLGLEKGQQIETELCIFTAHPKLIPDLLPPASLRTSHLDRLTNLSETTGFFMIYATVDGDISDIENKAIFIDTEEDIATSIAGKTIAESPVCVYLYSDKEQHLSVIAPCHHDLFDRALSEGNYQKLKQETTDILITRVLKAIPALDGRIHILDASTPITFGRYANNKHAGIYGVCHNKESGWLNPTLGIHGLFLAGQSILLPGILGSMISAFIASGLIVGMDNLQKEVALCSDAG